MNTPRGRGPRADGVHIRSAALAHQVPCLTTVAAARAAATGIADWRRHGLSVVCLQEVHAVRVQPSTCAPHVGSVPLPNPVLTASGTAGHGAELAAYVDLASLGAVVVKSLSAEPWPGNPAPRVHETPAGMLNSVGLQGPGRGGVAGRRAPRPQRPRRPGGGQHLGAARRGLRAGRRACSRARPASSPSRST